MRRNKNKSRNKGPRPSRPRLSNFMTSPRNSGRIKYSGNFLIQITLVAGANVIALNPGNFGNLPNTLSTVFLQFRFTRLMLRCHPVTSGSNYAVAINPGLDLVQGTGLAQVMQEPLSALVSSNQTVPQSLFAHRGILLGETPLKWFKCTAGAPYTTVQTTQGTINVVGTTGSAVVIEAEYSIEFDSADPDGLGLTQFTVWTETDLKRLRELNGEPKPIRRSEVDPKQPTKSEEDLVPHPEFEQFYTLDKEVQDLRKYLARIKVNSSDHP